MNYRKMYNKIIQLAKNRSSNIALICMERHHIKPKCMGGAAGFSDKRNIAVLTPKEHFVVHHLLTKIYPNNNKLHYAFWAMCFKKYKQRKYKISAIVYANAKHKIATIPRSKKMIDAIKKANKGRKRTPEAHKIIMASLIGKHHSKETNEKIALGNRGKYVSKASRLKISKALKGRKFSKKTRLLMSKNSRWNQI